MPSKESWGGTKLSKFFRRHHKTNPVDGTTRCFGGITNGRCTETSHLPQLITPVAILPGKENCRATLQAVPSQETQQRCLTPSLSSLPPKQNAQGAFCQSQYRYVPNKEALWRDHERYRRSITPIGPHERRLVSLEEFKAGQSRLLQSQLRRDKEDARHPRPGIRTVEVHPSPRPQLNQWPVSGLPSPSATRKLSSLHQQGVPNTRSHLVSPGRLAPSPAPIWPRLAEMEVLAQRLKAPTQFSMGREMGLETGFEISTLVSPASGRSTPSYGHRKKQPSLSVKTIMTRTSIKRETGSETDIITEGMKFNIANPRNGDCKDFSRCVSPAFVDYSSQNRHLSRKEKRPDREKDARSENSSESLGKDELVFIDPTGFVIANPLKGVWRNIEYRSG